MPESLIRVILDTNLWISFLISGRHQRLDTLFAQNAIRFLFSQELLEEFIEVAARPKFKKYFSDAHIAHLIQLFDTYGELVEVVSEVNICRDEADNFLLALAQDGQADFLVTGDADLLILRQLGQTKIMTYADFESVTMSDKE